FARRIAEPSPTARLAGGGIHEPVQHAAGQRQQETVGYQGPDQIDRDVGELSTSFRRHTRAACEGSGKPFTGPRSSFATPSGIHPRSGVSDQRSAECRNRRPQRLAVPTAGTLGGAGLPRGRQELDGSDVCSKPWKRPVPANHVHVLETDVAAANADYL